MKSLQIFLKFSYLYSCMQICDLYMIFISALLILGDEQQHSPSMNTVVVKDIIPLTGGTGKT